MRAARKKRLLFQSYIHNGEERKKHCVKFDLEGPIWLMDFLFVDSFFLSLLNLLVEMLINHTIHVNCEVYQKVRHKCNRSISLYNGQTIQTVRKRIIIKKTCAWIPLYNLMIEFFQILCFCKRTHGSITVFFSSCFFQATTLFIWFQLNFIDKCKWSMYSLNSVLSCSLTLWWLWFLNRLQYFWIYSICDFCRAHAQNICYINVSLLWI